MIILITTTAMMLKLIVRLNLKTTNDNADKVQKMMPIMMMM